MGENLKRDVINTAENFTRNFSNKGNFDYSAESLIKIDDLLDELSEFELDENTVHSVSSMVGSYIFEVARKNYGGEYYWIQESEQPILVTRKPDFDVSICAFQKVKDRLINGKEDKIMFYFKGYIDAVERGRKTGDCATII
jgi:hypothetical protein